MFTSWCIKALILFLFVLSMSNFSIFPSPHVHCLVSNSPNVRNEIASNYNLLSAITIFQLSLLNFGLIVVGCFSYIHTILDNFPKSVSLKAQSWLSSWLVLLLATENTYDINLALIINLYALWNHRIYFIIPKNICKSSSSLSA